MKTRVIPRPRSSVIAGLLVAAGLVAFALSPTRLPAAPAPAPSKTPDVAALLPPLSPVPAAVAPPSTAPGLFELTLRTDGRRDLGQVLVDAGAAPHEARTAASLLHSRVADIGAGADVKLSLGGRMRGGGRAIGAVAVLTDLGMERVVAGPAGLTLAPSPAARHVSVKVRSGTYWSLRAAGLAPELASKAAQLADHRLGAAPGGTVKTIVGERPARFGHAKRPQLLYVAVERPGLPARRLLSWPGDRAAWIDPDHPSPAPAALGRPVAGRITSGFGARFHPILHFFRPHRGVDFAARSGDPVRAVADGCVTAAGWSGGYGRQVRLQHRDGQASTYSHLHQIRAGGGQCVQRGDIIGLAGSSGLANGPHLHFEWHDGGKAVDPVARLASRAESDDGQGRAIAARLARLLAAPSA